MAGLLLRLIVLAVKLYPFRPVSRSEAEALGEQARVERPRRCLARILNSSRTSPGPGGRVSRPLLAPANTPTVAEAVQVTTGTVRRLPKIRSDQTRHL